MDREASPSLRERKRLATITRIQSVAVDLFEERGFDHVTVEEVAAAAGVSPSTVYRHFGTKERIVLHDEYDERLLQMVPGLLAEHDLLDAVRVALQSVGVDHYHDDLDLTLRRTRLWFDVPAVRSAGQLFIDEYTDWLAAELERSPRTTYTPVQARMVAGAVLGGFVAVIRLWYERGEADDLMVLIEEAMAAVSGLGPRGGS